MTKVARSKNLKSKLPQGDFGKKKTKVGRKVQRANVTKISVKTKKIFIPGQNDITVERSENEREAVTLLLKQLHHYSQPNKISALSELKDLLSESANAESFIGLILPEVMELMFNDEKEVRVEVINLISFLIIKFNPDSFMSVIPVAITYLCSGLTSIHKGVRKDSLTLLQTFAEHGSHLLMPFLEKLTRHVVALLHESFQSVTVSGGSQDAHVAQQQLKQQNSEKAVKDSKKKDGEAPKVVSMFILSLQVLQLLLSTSAAGIASTRNHGSTAMDVQTEDVTQLTFNSSSRYNSAVLLSAKSKSVCRWLANEKTKTNRVSGIGSSEGTKLKSNTDSHAQQHDISSAGGIPEDLAMDICHRLKNIWSGLVLEDSALPLSTIAILREITRIILSIEQAFPHMILAEFHLLISVFFQYFPHTCQEANLSQPGSVQEKTGNLAVQLMDISLCEIVFVYTSTLNGHLTGDSMVDAASALPSMTANATAAMVRVQEDASVYLLENLRIHLDSLSGDALAGSKKDKSNKNSEINSEIVQRIFTSFQLMISFNTLSTMRELLVLLNTQLFAKIGQGQSDVVLFSYLLEPSILCICDIVSKLYSDLLAVDLTTGGASENVQRREAIFVLLCESLTMLLSPVLITRFLSRSAVSTSSSSGRDSAVPTVVNIFTALLNLTRRIPSRPSVGEEDAAPRSTKFQSAVDAMLSAYGALVSYTHNITVNNLPVSQPYYVYQYSSSAMRYLLLDVYAQSSFEPAPLLAITKTLTKIVSNSRVSDGEQSYFLRLLLAKRHELSITDYVDVLFTSLRFYMLSYCSSALNNQPASSTDKVVQSAVIEAAVGVSGHWYVCHVAEQLRWIASSENPFKIIAYVLPRLVAYKDAAIAADSLLYSCASTSDASYASAVQGGGVRWMSQFGWLGCYTGSTAVLNTARYLLQSIDDASVLDGPSLNTVRDLLAVVNKAALALLTDEQHLVSLSVINKGSSLQQDSAVEGELLSAVALLVSMTSLPATSALLANDTQHAVYATMMTERSGSQGSAQYPLFSSFLAALTAVWKSSSTPVLRVRLLKGLKTLLLCRSINADMVTALRGELLVLLRIFSDSKHPINAGRDPREFDTLQVVVRDIIDTV